MAGIYQQIPSSGFITANDGIASKEIQAHGFINNELGGRCCRNASLDTIKALVIKKNF